MALSSKQRKALRDAKKDGKITAKESRRLINLGIPKRQAQVTKGNKGKTNTSNQTKSDDKNRNKNKTEPSVLNVKQLSKLRAEIKQNDGAVRNETFSRNDGSTGDTQGRINYTAYGGKKDNALGQNPKSGKNANIWGNVAKELGIKKVDTDEDVQRLITYVDNYGTKNTGDGKKEVVYGGRGSGEYQDIISSIEADANAGIDAAEELKNKGVRETRGKYKDDLQDIRDKRNNGLGLGPLAIAPKDKDSISREALGVPTLNKGNNNRGGSSAQSAVASEKVTSSKGNKSAKTNAFDSSTTYASGVSAPGVKGKGNGTIDPFANSLTTTRGPGVTAPTPNSRDKITKPDIAASGFNPADYGAKGLGLQDYDELKARGYNDNQIKSYAEGLQGVNIGGKLQEKLAGISGGADGGADGGEPEGPTLADILNEQQLLTDEKISGITDEYTAELDGLSLQIQELGSINDNWAAANAFMQDQMLAANAARDLAEQRASNMRNAFVPNANPTALSVLYGDNRKGGRRQQDNQLSDLSILSGLGTNSNPLAGLQLA